MPVAAIQPDQRGRDARENRAAILEAARDLFADSTDVAMSPVAKRAGVGQATLYRNFPSRSALAAEILDEHFERISALAAEHEGDPDAFFVLLRHPDRRLITSLRARVLARNDAATDSHLQRARAADREPC